MQNTMFKKAQFFVPIQLMQQIETK